MKSILIVEDNDLNMKLFNDLLEVKGFKTLKARNGYEAIQTLHQETIDLIIMDIQLPQVSGLEVIRWIKGDQRYQKIPILAVTAYAMKGDEERILDEGCEAYLSKPISVTTFLETIQRFI